MIFEMSCKKLNPDIDRSITLEKYTEIWLQTIAPDKLAKSTLVREKQDIERFKPYLGSYKLVDLRPEHFRSLYAKLRKQKNKANGKPLSEATVEGVHSCLCGILSDAMEGGYLDHNPAWRTYKYAGQKKEKKIADDETVKKLIQALETVSILYETYFKLIIATGMRRGECCALKWEDINYAERSIHVCRNAVKTTGDEIIVKAPKTKAGNRYVYFSAEMESLLREYEAFCAAETERYDRREQRRAGRYRHGKRHIAAGDESHHIRGGAAGRAAQEHHADRNICRKVEQNAERIGRKRHDRELCHNPCQYFFRTADNLTEISRRKREAHAEHHHTEEHRNIRTDQLENLGENESENAEDNHPQGEGLVHKLAHFHEIFHIVHSMRF